MIGQKIAGFAKYCRVNRRHRGHAVFAHLAGMKFECIRRDSASLSEGFLNGLLLFGICLPRDMDRYDMYLLHRHPDQNLAIRAVRHIPQPGHVGLQCANLQRNMVKRNPSAALKTMQRNAVMRKVKCQAGKCILHIQFLITLPVRFHPKGMPAPSIPRRGPQCHGQRVISSFAVTLHPALQL